MAAVGAGVALGYGVNQIPGVSEALTIPVFSEVLSEVLLVFSKSKGGGLDTGLPKDAGALDKMKEDADKRTKEGKELIRRINRQLKNLRKRNMRKHRGQPTRRGPIVPLPNEEPQEDQQENHQQEPQGDQQEDEMEES